MVKCVRIYDLLHTSLAAALSTDCKKSIHFRETRGSKQTKFFSEVRKVSEEGRRPPPRSHGYVPDKDEVLELWLNYDLRYNVVNLYTHTHAGWAFK